MVAFCFCLCFCLFSFSSVSFLFMLSNSRLLLTGFLFLRFLSFCLRSVRNPRPPHPRPFSLSRLLPSYSPLTINSVLLPSQVDKMISRPPLRLSVLQVSFSLFFPFLFLRGIAYLIWSVRFSFPISCSVYIFVCFYLIIESFDRGPIYYSPYVSNICTRLQSVCWNIVWWRSNMIMWHSRACFF